MKLTQHVNSLISMNSSFLGQSLNEEDEGRLFMTAKLPNHWDKVLQRVENAVRQIRKGGMIVLTDNESRENEGDLVFAASLADKEKINFMIKHARGLVCLALDSSIISRLELSLMKDSSKATAAMETAFTVSIDAKEGISTGISAADRAKTILTAMQREAKPQDLVGPGHIFPLQAQGGGVLSREGHTEGSVDLVKLAGEGKGAVICEIIKDDGEMARGKDLSRFALRYMLPKLSIEDLVCYRKSFQEHKRLHLAKDFSVPAKVFLEG